MPPQEGPPSSLVSSPSLGKEASLPKEKERQEAAKEQGKEGNSLLDKDWGARLPPYIQSCLLSSLVFVLGLTMKGDWLLFLTLGKRGLEDRGQEDRGQEDRGQEDRGQEDELKDWFQGRFEGYLTILVSGVISVFSS